MSVEKTALAGWELYEHDEDVVVASAWARSIGTWLPEGAGEFVYVYDPADMVGLESLASIEVAEDASTAQAPELNQLTAAIDESRDILDWPDNWDGEGSVGYHESTWNRAKDFLLASAARLWEEYGRRIAAPRVLPGPDGSIDIHWQTGNSELLVNIPVDLEEPTTYYGDDVNGNIARGRLNTSSPAHWLLLWVSH